MKSLNGYKRIMLIIAVVVTLGSFITFSSLFSNHIVVASNGYGAKDIQNQNVKSLTEATEIAGYDVCTITDLPPKFSPNPGGINLSPLSFRDTSSSSVFQMWVSSDSDYSKEATLAEIRKNEFVYLFQAPAETLDHVEGGKPTVINGLDGEYSYSPANDYRPPLCALLWQKNGISYLLVATLTDNISTDAVYRMASSVR